MLKRYHSILIPFAACLGLVSQAVATTDTAVFFINDLTIERGVILSMSPENLILSDDSTGQRIVPFADLVSIGIENESLNTLPNFSEQDSNEQVFVDLIDGQRLVIEIADSRDSAALYGAVSGFGPASIPLERILRITRPGDQAEPSLTETDRIILTNGDELTGFIATLGKTIKIESDSGAITTVELTRAQSVHLANPAETVQGLFLTDTTGTRLLARTFRVDGDRAFRATIDAATLGVDSNGEDEVVYTRNGVKFVSAARVVSQSSIIPLANIQPSDVQPTGDRRWTPSPERTSSTTPPIFIPDIRLPAPATVRFPIPRNADRFACEVAHTGGAWTDCVAIVLAESRDGSLTTLGRVRLSANDSTPWQQAGEINVALPNGTVSIILEVDPGAFGAIQDSVLFGKPRLRVR
ncbi:MAG: hypothetical protein AB8F26_10470 [Phycisphaerales bacterium]